MNWGTFDANGHTPKTDIMDRPVTNWQQEPIHESRTSGGSEYTLSRTDHGETPVPPPPPPPAQNND